MKRAACATLMAWLLVTSGAAAAPQADHEGTFAGWPTSWIEAYERFEAYIAAREANWPKNILRISEDGKATTTIPSPQTPTEHFGVVTYKHGRRNLSGLLKAEFDLHARAQIFEPGIYAAYVDAATMLGYQAILPIVWFEVSEPAAPRGGRGFRLINPPRPGEEVWPNERLRLFLDFHIFPKRHHPDAIRKANSKVAPAIKLNLQNDGAIERELLDDPAAERLLRWRIYRNGELVERSSAEGVKRIETARGTGTYQVLIGVDGPTGFMPVSNVLEYPLFPRPDGRSALVPLPGQREEIGVRVMADRRRRETATAAAESVLSAEDRLLADVLFSWAYELDHDDMFKGVMP